MLQCAIWLSKLAAATAGPPLGVPVTFRALTVPQSDFLHSPALPCLAVHELPEVTK